MKNTFAEDALSDLADKRRNLIQKLASDGWVIGEGKHPVPVASSRLNAVKALQDLGLDRQLGRRGMAAFERSLPSLRLMIEREYGLTGYCPTTNALRDAISLAHPGAYGVLPWEEPRSR